MTRSTALSLLVAAVVLAGGVLFVLFMPVTECNSGWGHAELLEPGQTPTPTPVGLDENGCVTRSILDF